MTYRCTVCRQEITTSQVSDSMKFGPVLCPEHLAPHKDEVLERRKSDRRRREYFKSDMPEIRELKECIWELKDRRQA